MKEKEKEKLREIVDESRLAGLIDHGTELKGELNFKGSFRIEGYFQGKIFSDAMLIIGEKGKVEADIKVGQLIINGEIHGNIQARERIEVHNRGRVFGTLITPRLVVEEGAYLEASCQTTEVAAGSPEAPGVKQST
ncbi:MAG: polymer-forming cytoskeletal protein [Candidatus Saccharicenans sp.]|nr:polymer-forming cytoskeletal protein [Candidatus Saccharicenans sp.]MDI6848316.1 polymer-forming cytoskeletal protein [Candidatus Saccharicenans sp.]